MISDDGMTITDHDDVGELVGTGFRNPAMTLIRYRTGDLGSGMRWQQCRCGRDFPTLDKIHGRIQDYLVTSDGCKVPFTAVLYGLHLPIFEYYAKIQVEQSEPGRIKVRLENRDRISHASHIVASKNAIERALEGRMLVFFEEVDVIPAKANGKHQVIIQHLPIL
jgi:phenylacetate-CoA ligase